LIVVSISCDEARGAGQLGPEFLRREDRGQQPFLGSPMASVRVMSPLHARNISLSDSVE
jgi:hypothetical protein